MGYLILQAQEKFDVEFFSKNLLTLSSMLGQYLGPEPVIEPEKTGEDLMLS